MAEKKTIAVVGATGAQGGGLVRAILSDVNSGFTARALTRNLNSDKATELGKLGADVVAADLDEIESLKRAFEGVYGAFCGLEHVIWSTLEDTRQWMPLSDNMDKYKVPHFDAKGEANHQFTDLGVPTTFLLTSFYWDNFIHFGLGPKRGPDGTLTITLAMGDKKLPGIAAGDIGKCTYGIFQRGHELIGKTIGVAGEHLTGTEMAAAFTRALGEEVRYNDVSADLGNEFRFERDFNEIHCGARNVEIARGLNPRLQSFDEWLARNKTRIPLE